METADASSWLKTTPNRNYVPTSVRIGATAWSLPVVSDSARFPSVEVRNSKYGSVLAPAAR